MMPSEVIREWGNCGSEMLFDRVLKLTPPIYPKDHWRETDSELDFGNKAKAAFKRIHDYLENYGKCLDNEDTPSLLKLKETMRLSFSQVDLKSKKIAKARRKAKKIVNTLIKLKPNNSNNLFNKSNNLFVDYTPVYPLTKSLDIIQGYDNKLIKVVSDLAAGKLVSKKQLLGAIRVYDQKKTVREYMQMRSKLKENGDLDSVRAMDQAFPQVFIPSPEAFWLAKYPILRGEEESHLYFQTRHESIKHLESKN